MHDVSYFTQAKPYQSGNVYPPTNVITNFYRPKRKYHLLKQIKGEKEKDGTPLK